ncbi:MAG: DUF3558 domain-containing protein [Cyclobacteriaceae bacterium]|nr:DUF3558 domain-containing protein [Cyclobacteriaceae bacterium]
MRLVNFLIICFLIVSCGPKSGSGSELPQDDSGEQPTLNGVCGYLTKTEVERALGVRLSEEPAEINEEYLGGRGCSYVGETTGMEAHFGYVIFTTIEEFEKVKVGKPTSGIGDEAYTIDGPDAQQLWVREGDLYVMVAIGDVPRPKESKVLAQLVLTRLKTKPIEL